MIPPNSKNWQILDVWPFKQTEHLFEFFICRSVCDCRIDVIATRHKKFWLANRIISPLANK
jgi:hypothetical protein